MYPTGEGKSLSMLAQLGISTENDSRRGNRRIGGSGDISRSTRKSLMTFLKTKMSDVKSLFGFDTDGDLVIDSGVARSIDAALTPYVQTGGIFGTRTSGLATKITTTEKKITQLDAQLAAKEAELKTKYGQMEGTLNNLQRSVQFDIEFQQAKQQLTKKEHPMDLFINGGKIDFEAEGEKTVGEMLGSIESACEKEGMTITGIRADGREIPAGDLDNLFTGAIDSIGMIELSTISGNDVKNLIRELGDKFAGNAALLREIPVQLQTGKDLTVMETINSFFLEPSGSVSPDSASLDNRPFPERAVNIDGIALDAYPAELTPLLSDLLDGLQKSRHDPRRGICPNTNSHPESSD